MKTSLLTPPPVDAGVSADAASEEEAEHFITQIAVIHRRDVPAWMERPRGMRVESPLMRSPGKLPAEVLRSLSAAVIEKSVQQGFVKPSEESEGGDSGVFFVPLYRLIRDNLEGLGTHVIAPLHAFEQAFSKFALVHGCMSRDIGLVVKVTIENGAVASHEAYMAIDRRADAADVDFEPLVVDPLDEDAM